MNAGPARSIVTLATALTAALTAALKADAALAGLAGGRVHDGPPKADVTPWLAVADAGAFDWSTGDGPGARVSLTLEAEGSDAERARTLAILERAALVAEALPPALGGGGRVVLLRASAASIGRIDGGRRWRGRMTIEALVEG